MSFIADLHIHSYYSRATSKQLDLEHLNKWGQLKGLHVIGTGDFTHPKWLDEMQEKLEPAEEGLFKLKAEYIKTTQDEVFKSCESQVRFMFSTEISNIYKKNDKVRKNHNVVFVPSFEAARKLQARLEKIGNIRSDGRPILGLDAKDLLEIVLETDESAFLIPAHIWTPWFSVLGSKSGFDSIEECFEDLTEHIFALETGLSSDPPMNWRVSGLDRYTLVSNSDAHSPQKLAREANIFHCELAYPEMLNALKTGDPSLFGGTIEFYPEEGKYHLDGHRKCNMRMEPEETIANKGLCPVCGKPVTLGVSYRVAELADRKLGEKHDRTLPFRSLIPLPEIVAEVKNKGVNTKTVQKQVDTLQMKLGSELNILQQIPLTDIEKHGGSILAEAIRRTRSGELNFDAGYDGEYGVVRIFTGKERADLDKQIFFFAPEKPKQEYKETRQVTLFKVQDEPENSDIISVIPIEITSESEEEKYNGMNKLQYDTIHAEESFILIVAGPGTGKTRTLTQRIVHLIDEKQVNPENILAITFTNKAAEEMRNRLSGLLDSKIVSSLTIKTFHAFCALILRQESEALNYPVDFTIFSEFDRLQILKQIAKNQQNFKIRDIADKISDAKNSLLLPEQCNDGIDFSKLYQNYQNFLKLSRAFDFDDLIFQTVLLLRSHSTIQKKYQDQFRWISVDEYQDINHAQYQLLRLLISPDTNLCAIGDPDQAIYGFRGSDYKYFLKFREDFPGAKIIQLEKNYRSTQTILSASSQVIDKNTGRNKRELWSDIISEGKLDIFKTPTDKAEAETVVHQIEKLVGATSFFSVDSGRAGHEDTSYCSGFSDIAVLFRTNAQLPPLEEAFIRSGIPYQTLGETPFWELREVREIISYLRIILNPNSDLDLHRILNVPPRGIGDQTLNILLNYKTTNQLSLWQALKNCHIISSLSETQRAPVHVFINKIEELHNQVKEMPVAEFIETMIQQVGLASYFKNDNKRTYYWKAIIDRAKQKESSLPGFLETVMLEKETDIYDPKAEKVTLMTIHASKGLEFPVVFITGCEEGLIPYQKQGEKINIEEERRLFYVGMTRAKNKLILTHTSGRFLFGKHLSNTPSRFLADIELTLKEYKMAAIKRKQANEQKNKSNPQMSLF